MNPFLQLVTNTLLPFYYKKCLRSYLVETMVKLVLITGATGTQGVTGNYFPYTMDKIDRQNLRRFYCQVTPTISGRVWSALSHSNSYIWKGTGSRKIGRASGPRELDGPFHSGSRNGWSVGCLGGDRLLRYGTWQFLCLLSATLCRRERRIMLTVLVGCRGWSDERRAAG